MNEPQSQSPSRLPTQNGTATSGSGEHHSIPLLPVEIEIIDVFVRLAQELDIPRSVGQIYGLLFCSLQPMSFESITHRLQISSGSTSQGLRFLRNIGAARSTFHPGDRRDYWTAETGLRKLAAGILREKVEPHLQNAEDRIQTMRTLLSEAQPPQKQQTHLTHQIDRLEKWKHRGQKLLPLILRVVE
jgi:DNA-binding transcriptional regulator GbsR (MarR family)